MGNRRRRPQTLRAFRLGERYAVARSLARRSEGRPPRSSLRSIAMRPTSAERARRDPVRGRRRFALGARGEGESPVGLMPARLLSQVVRTWVAESWVEPRFGWLALRSMRRAGVSGSDDTERRDTHPANRFLPIRGVDRASRLAPRVRIARSHPCCSEHAGPASFEARAARPGLVRLAATLARRGPDKVLFSLRLQTAGAPVHPCGSRRVQRAVSVRPSPSRGPLPPRGGRPPLFREERSRSGLPFGAIRPRETCGGRRGSLGSAPIRAGLLRARSVARSPRRAAPRHRGCA
jgi:hypothetical protein